MSFLDIAHLTPESIAAIERQARIGTIKGYTDGRFGPHDFVTREQIALMFDRHFFWGNAKAKQYTPTTVSIFHNTAGTGAGFFVRDKNSGTFYICTARHVIAQLVNINDNMQIWSVNDQRWQYYRSWWGLMRSDMSAPQARVFYKQDVASEDIAIIAMTDQMRAALPANIPYIKLDTEEAEVGDPVVCIGCPLNFENVVTIGEVAKPTFQFYAHCGDFIFVSAGINPGNSGGPVFNAEDRVIGMATLKSWYQSAFGYTAADDLGWVLTAKTIRDWAKRSASIELE